MTPKQAAFVREYLKDCNATQAAIRAGYSEKTANREGSRLLSNVDIAAAIAKGQESLSKRSQLDQEWLLSRLQAEAELPVGQDGNSATRISAMNSIAKMLGLMVEKHKVEQVEQVKWEIVVVDAKPKADSSDQTLPPAV